MAVGRILPGAAHYIGVSSDDKPMLASNGSTFYAVDTGESWIAYDGMWEPDLRGIPYANPAERLIETL